MLLRRQQLLRYPCFIMLTAISNLFGVGGASAIARALGKKNETDARRISTISIYGGVLSGILFSMAFALLASPILHLCGATEETYPIAYGYALWVVILGGPFTILNTLMANLIRAEGAASIAAFGVSLGGILNILLDPLFVLPDFLGYGAVGAGMATALSNVAAVGYFAVYLMRKRSTYLSVSPSHLRFAGQYLRPILSIGLLAALQYALTVVATASQASFVSKYPLWGLLRRWINCRFISPLVYPMVCCHCWHITILPAIKSVGNNPYSSVRLSPWALPCSVCSAMRSSPIPSRPFSFRTRLPLHTELYSCVAFVAMPMMALCYLMIIQFQAMGLAKESTICSILRKGVLDIPLLFLMDYLFPLYGCMWVQPIVDTISLVVALYLYRALKKPKAVG